ncbi:hypothetical protein [Flavobacterium aurantiibacter]|uniref:hypothetical protein n=1 Tax=Flavobacterium aurantiibacter TaxID=2023067 RepID=UPI0013FDF336|nr:hypothetical protein [Flavobacterium aurantiibacter]
MKKKIKDFTAKEAIVKSELLAHVLGGLDDSGRCKELTSKYNDTVYVKPPVLPKSTNIQ